MKKIYLIYFIGALLLSQIFHGTDGISNEWQAALSLSFIALVGIPHGAIDHLMYEETGGKNKIKFYINYFFWIASIILLWSFSEALGFFCFLIVSAHHFGQSQFYDVRGFNTILKHLLFLSWGTSILSGLISCGYEHIDFTILGASSIDLWIQKIGQFSFQLITIISTLVFLILFTVMYVKEKMNKDRFSSEVFVLVLLHIVFFILPPILSFTLYFIGIHSISSLISEFQFFQKKKKVKNIKQFIFLLLPFTLISLFGVVFLYGLSIFGWLELSVFNVLFATVAGLTLPHAITMNRYYSRFNQSIH